MSFRNLIAVCLIFFVSPCIADVYSGSAMVDSNRGPRPMSIIYTFDSTHKSNLRGYVELSRERGGPCMTKRSIDGSTIIGSEVALSAPPSPELQSLGCNSFDIVGTIDGDKILGKFMMQGKPYEIVLTKQ